MTEDTAATADMTGAMTIDMMDVVVITETAMTVMNALATTTATLPAAAATTAERITTTTLVVKS